MAEEFILQYYASVAGDPAAGDRPARARRGDRWPRRWPSAAALRWRSARRARGQAAHLRAGPAQRAPGARPGPAALRAPPHPAHRGARRPPAGARDGDDPDADRVLRHLQPDGGPHGGLDGGVRGRGAQEGGLPRFGIRDVAQDDFAAMAEVLSRRMAQYVAQRERSPHDRDFDESFAPLPPLIVIDGGKGQLSAGTERRSGRSATSGSPWSAWPSGSRKSSSRAPDAPPAVPRDARAAAAPASARRGAPVRHRVPPRPARQGDDALGARRPAGGGAGAQASASCTTSARRSASAAEPRGARGGAGAAWQGGSRHPQLRQQGALMPPTVTKADRHRGLRPDHRLLRRGQVAGDGHLRGRRLLLRGQPAARDDRRWPSCSASRGRRSSARPWPPTCAAATTSTGWCGCSTTSTVTRLPAPAALPRGHRGRADQPLQGDAPPPPAGQRRLGGRAIAAARSSAPIGRAPTSASTPAICRPAGCARSWPTRCCRGAPWAGSPSRS